MREVMQREKCDKDQAFNMTTKSGPIEFNRRLRDVARNCDDPSFKENHLVFLDKNFPENLITRTIGDIQNFIAPNVKCKYLYLIPDVDPKTTILKLPFNASFMLQAFSRC